MGLSQMGQSFIFSRLTNLTLLLKGIAKWVAILYTKQKKELELKRFTWDEREKRCCSK